MVQVVTTGTDWAALAAAISGGLVGLAGVGATIWVALKNIRTQESSATLAEKRRVYARYLDTMAEVIATSTADKLNSAERNEKLGAALNAVSVLLLIAPNELGLLAEGTLVSLQNYRPGQPTSSDFPRARQRLIQAMRADLGLPELSSAQLAASVSPD